MWMQGLEAMQREPESSSPVLVREGPPSWRDCIWGSTSRPSRPIGRCLMAWWRGRTAHTLTPRWPPGQSGTSWRSRPLTVGQFPRPESSCSPSIGPLVLGSYCLVDASLTASEMLSTCVRGLLMGANIIQVRYGAIRYCDSERAGTGHPFEHLQPSLVSLPVRSWRTYPSADLGTHPLTVRRAVPSFTMHQT